MTNTNPKQKTTLACLILPSEASVGGVTSQLIIGYVTAETDKKGLRNGNKS